MAPTPPLHSPSNDEAARVARHRQAENWLQPARIRRLISWTVGLTALWIGWTVSQTGDWSGLAELPWNGSWLGIAMVLALLRDLGYVWRLHLLSDGLMGMRRTVSGILLWELSSALTPSVVGGSAVATFILNRNGLNWGRSLATVMATALLDELFFLAAVLMVSVAVGWDAFLPASASWIEGSIPVIFGGGVAFMASLAVLLSSALFWAPDQTHRALLHLSSRPWMSRWAKATKSFAGDLNVASRGLRSMSRTTWCAAACATALSWTARFLTLNAVLLAFVAPVMDWMEVSQFDIWARQLSLWTVMLVSPTPGSAGLAELALPTFLTGLLPLVLAPTAWTALVLVWRLLTYHLYVLLGAITLPVWLKQTGVPSRTFRNP